MPITKGGVGGGSVKGGVGGQCPAVLVWGV